MLIKRTKRRIRRKIEKEVTVLKNWLFHVRTALSTSHTSDLGGACQAYVL
jgi:hypothetical protein